MSNLRNFEKDPNATVDFSVDWSDWLGSDSISTGTWIIPSGLATTTSFYTAKVATVYLSSGSADQTYTVVNRITTTGGRINDQTIYILVKEQ